MLRAVCQLIFTGFFSKFFIKPGVHEGKYFLKLVWILWQMLNSYSEICRLAFCGTWLQQSMYSW